MAGTLWSTSGLVYFALAPKLGVVKLGWSANPPRRLQQLTCMHYVDLHLIATVLGSRWTEASLHRRFAQHATEAREWYWATAPMLAYAMRKGGFREPLVVPYTGRIEAPWLRGVTHDPYDGRYWRRLHAGARVRRRINRLNGNGRAGNTAPAEMTECADCTEVHCSMHASAIRLNGGAGELH